MARSHQLTRAVRAARERPIRNALASPLIRRYTAAYLAATVAEWTMFIGTLVYAFDHGGPSVAGITSIVMLTPFAIVSPYAGRTVDRYRPNVVRLLANVVQTGGLAFSAISASVGASVAVVVAGALVAVAATTLLRPACAVLAPSMARSTRELAALNVLAAYCDNTSVFLGPLLATVALAVSGPALVLAGCAALTFFSAVVTLRDALKERDVPRPQRTEAPLSAARLAWHSVAALSRRPGATGVLALASGQHILVGALELILVVLANDVLALRPSGTGLLATSVGVGAVVCALTATTFSRRARLAPLMVGACAAISVVSIVLGALPSLYIALIGLPILGFSRSLLNLTSRSLLQRSSPPEALGSLFAVLEMFTGVGMLLGSIVAKVLISAGGTDAAFVGVAVFFAVLLLITWSSLRVADDSADIPIVAINLLRSMPLLAPLPSLELESIARGADEVTVAAGQVVVAEGDVGDQFYAVADGSFDVTICGVRVATIERGGSFGEIALLSDVPRTATVTASRAGLLLSIGREQFLTAVTGSDACHRAAWGQIRTLPVGAILAQPEFSTAAADLPRP